MLSSVNFRRYQQENRLPSRFKTSANVANELQPAQPPSAQPMYNTTYQEYGKYQVTSHTQPYSYHGLKTKFSHKKQQQGMYRNHSLNV